MIPDDEINDGKNGLVIPLGKLEVDISVFSTHREIGIGIAFLFGGPFYYQVFGIHLHLLVVSVQFDFFKRSNGREEE